MARMTELDHYRYFVQDQMQPGKYASAEFVALCFGPPMLRTFTGTDGGDVVFPTGMIQNFSMMQNMALARIFELGSRRSYMFPGKVVGALTYGRPYYHGPSLLRCVMAYYYGEAPGEEFSSVFNHSMRMREDGSYHPVRVPPGYDNLFLNLASDLFMQPHGELLLIKDSDSEFLGALYFEQAYCPAHNFSVDAQGIVFQEGLQVQYERQVPVDVKGIPLENPDTVFENDKPVDSTVMNIPSGAL